MSFVRRLVGLREAAGLTQSQLSRLALIERTYVGKVERLTNAEVGLSRLIALAFVLGASLDYLVFGRGEVPAGEHVRAAVEHARRNPAAIRNAIERALGTPRTLPAARAATLRTRARRARAKASPARPLPAGPSLARTSLTPEARP